MRDIDLVIARIKAASPSVEWVQLRAKSPADDDGIWFFWMPGLPGEVQVESSHGASPFLIETDKHNERASLGGIDDVVETVLKWLALPGGAQSSPWHMR